MPRGVSWHLPDSDDVGVLVGIAVVSGEGRPPWETSAHPHLDVNQCTYMQVELVNSMRQLSDIFVS